MPTLIKIVFSAYLLLACSLTSTLIFAQTSKEDVEIENIKAPPRDIKDILKNLGDIGNREGVIKANRTTHIEGQIKAGIEKK